MTLVLIRLADFYLVSWRHLTGNCVIVIPWFPPYDRGNDSFSRHVKDSLTGHVDVSSYTGSNRVKAIRRLKPDLLLDLNGWTSGQVIPELMSRLAPIQVNFLGYFASTGVSEIDFWLGDDQLFLDPMREWHEETIWRLPRPSLPGSQVTICRKLCGSHHATCRPNPFW